MKIEGLPMLRSAAGRGVYCRAWSVVVAALLRQRRPYAVANAACARGAKTYPGKRPHRPGGRARGARGTSRPQSNPFARKPAPIMRQCRPATSMPCRWKNPTSFCMALSTVCNSFSVMAKSPSMTAFVVSYETLEDFLARFLPV